MSERPSNTLLQASMKFLKFDADTKDTNLHRVMVGDVYFTRQQVAEQIEMLDLAIETDDGRVAQKIADGIRFQRAIAMIRESFKHEVENELGEHPAMKRFKEIAEAECVELENLGVPAFDVLENALQVARNTIDQLKKEGFCS